MALQAVPNLVARFRHAVRKPQLRQSRLFVTLSPVEGPLSLSKDKKSRLQQRAAGPIRFG